jgi:5-formyltetrahydrofolate cyclo-ligase
LTKREARALYPALPDGGAAASRLVKAWEEDGEPDSVFCYVSEPEECATEPVLRYCFERGIPLAVPLCEGSAVMTARLIRSYKELRRGAFGLWEPPEDAPVTEQPAWVVVPGLAFDRNGFRLGRGGGYYDRWLAGKTGRFVGLCHPGRFVEGLPRDDWDMPVDTVITGVEICRTIKNAPR